MVASNCYNDGGETYSGSNNDVQHNHNNIAANSWNPSQFLCEFTYSIGSRGYSTEQDNHLLQVECTGTKTSS